MWNITWYSWSIKYAWKSYPMIFPIQWNQQYFNLPLYVSLILFNQVYTRDVNGRAVATTFFWRTLKTAWIWWNFSVYKWNTLRLNQSNGIVPIFLVHYSRGSGAVAFFSSVAVRQRQLSAAMDISGLYITLV
jgi:hypothetical protein